MRYTICPLVVAGSVAWVAGAGITEAGAGVLSAGVGITGAGASVTCAVGAVSSSCSDSETLGTCSGEGFSGTLRVARRVFGGFRQSRC